MLGAMDDATGKDRMASQALVPPAGKFAVALQSSRLRGGGAGASTGIIDELAQSVSFTDDHTTAEAIQHAAASAVPAGPSRARNSQRRSCSALMTRLVLDATISSASLPGCGCTCPQSRA
eukprot:2120093-Prymnesium_polylepis.1